MADRQFHLRGLAQKRNALSAIEDLPIDPGKPFIVSISAFNPGPRTLPQLGLFWRLINRAARESGWTPATAHDVICAEYWGTATIRYGNGMKMLRPAQTLTNGPDGEKRRLSKPDMAAFLTFAIAYFAQHFGIVEE